jgi:SsrA-binding protein
MVALHGGTALRLFRPTPTPRMAEKSKKKKDAKTGPSIDVVAENRKARHKFEVLDTLECGVALAGSEVKSIRMRHVSLDEAYARVRDGEVWLVNCDIPEYMQAGMFNHVPKRPRKLLLHRSEIRKFANKAHESGLTLVPLRLYFNERGVVKVLLGLCRGKKLHDKREAMKKAETKREIARAVRRR